MTIELKIATQKITEPGFYRLPERAYHADPCPVPSLSRSIAQTALSASLAHAKAMHPILGHYEDPDYSQAAALGSCCHALAFGGFDELITVIDAADFRGKVAKTAREEAEAQGKTAILQPYYQTGLEMYAALLQSLEDYNHPATNSLLDGGMAKERGHAEVTAVCMDANGIWLRSRLDWMHVADDRVTIIDYKTTALSADPFTLGKTLFNQDYHFQDAFYTRVITQLMPQIMQGNMAVDFLFLVQETKPPYEVSLARIDMAGQVIAAKKVSAAIRLWTQAINENTFTGYPRRIVTADMPAWEETRWLEREVSDPRFEGLPPDRFMQAVPQITDKTKRSPEDILRAG
ncbi:MAG: PD-(D/E)XK nuclease-like domain-containing protein [Pseudomonadota bacterium]